MKGLARGILIAMMFLFVGFNAVAQSDSIYGYADPSIKALAQFEYYRGKWKTEMEMVQDDGTFEKIDFTAEVIGRFLDDHRTFQIQFKGSNGFFSTDIRSFDTTERKWKSLFLNAKAQRWQHFTSEMVNGKMTALILGGYSGKEDFDIKLVDHPVSEDNYLREVYHSYDEMQNWKLVYKINVVRVE